MRRLYAVDRPLYPHTAALPKSAEGKVADVAISKKALKPRGSFDFASPFACQWADSAQGLRRGLHLWPFRV